MYSLLYDEILKTCDVIVVKVGTNVLSLPSGLLNEPRMVLLCRDLSQMIQKKKRIILVSSGAVGAGMGQLKLTERPAEIDYLQAVAAVGQGKLIETYEHFLRIYGVQCAQILLTANDISNRESYLNVRNTLRILLDLGILPIINENDTVSVERLHTTFGDNDRLASLIANLFEQPLLLLLTDVDGLFDRDPSLPGAKLIPLVEQWSPDLMQMAAEKRSSRSKGGMSSKLKAAKMITASGGNVIIANGDREESLQQIFAANETGTLFLAQNHFLTARKRWLGFAVQSNGRIIIDDGAVNAIVKRGRSLLPVGIVDADGSFERGEIVSLVDRHHQEVGRGLTNYGLRDVLRICGKKTSELQEIIGQHVYMEVVHRDNLQIIENG
ncbi:MAG: glutamate 5-kinase [Planctomycetaceae bacterium]|jgi:glutamate 5-kinase|nr:glutamate 5-kinase [Planctomycetaceae bacterium]